MVLAQALSEIFNCFSYKLDASLIILAQRFCMRILTCLFTCQCCYCVHNVSLIVLQFASSAKTVKNRPIINEASNDSEALMRKYRRQIMELEQKLEEVCLFTF